MNQNREMIRGFVTSVLRRFAGSGAEHRAALAELRDLPEGAQARGELQERLGIHGTPDTAAGSISPDRHPMATPIGRRWRAALIDNLALILLALLLFVTGLGGGAAGFSFPPFLYWEFERGCIALVPSCSDYPPGPLETAVTPSALTWSVIALGLIESRRGTTPGESSLGLRVVGRDGLRLRPGQTVLCGTSFLLGSLAWFDWIPALWDDRRRVPDRLAEARVVTQRSQGGMVWEAEP